MNRKNNKLKQSESGQIAVIAALMIASLFGFAALAVDVGSFESNRRIMQTAADAAALAGTRELLMGYNSSMLTAAKNDAASNGFTDGTNGVTVTVNNPPTGGAYATLGGVPNPNAVEVIIKKPAPTFFMRALGIPTVNVSARAVADFTDAPDCIYILDPSASGAFALNGGGYFKSACGIVVDSNSSTALTVSGSVALTAPSIGVVGGYSGSISPAPTTGIAAVSDPLSALAAPSVGGCSFTNLSISGTTTLNPGTYCGGISMSSKSNTTFNPGTYIIAGGGLSTQGNATIQGNGVTFYLTSTTGYPYAGINLQGSSSVVLSAPTSGSLKGILFFQDRTISAATAAANPSNINGGSKSTYNGTLYFPTTALNYSGTITVSDGPYTLIVADKLTLGGNTTTVINASVGNDYTTLTNGSPIKGAQVVE